MKGRLRLPSPAMLVSLAALFVALGGTGVAASTVVAATGKPYVLKLRDLPAGWSITTQGKRSNAQTARENGEPVAAYEAWGRITGWRVAFERQGSLKAVLTGPVLIESVASVYRTAGGARAAWRDGDLRRARRDPPAGTTVQRLSVGVPLGHASYAIVVTVTTGSNRGSAVAVAWRYDRVIALVIASGIEGTVDASEVITLARRQHKRIMEASR